jgi:hopanoid biosynthesis associated RND transporter like protein HpnN
MTILTTTVVQAIKQCIGHPRLVVIIAILMTAASAGYSARHFTLNADINKLISPEIPWRKREIAFNALFPQFDVIVAVVQAPTPELAGKATATLAADLAKRQDLFRSVTTPGGSEFFARNGLLFQPPEQLKGTLDLLTKAEPLIEVLASDPSLRGITQTLSFGVMGTQRGQITLDAMTRPMTMASDTVERVLAGEKASFSWLTLVAGHPPNVDELRRIILIRPILDFAAIEPGKVATDTIRAAAANLKLAELYQASVRLTGPVPMADEEFGTIKENALLNGTITILVVLFILWRALGSGRIILAVFLNLVVGLAITAALGLLMVGALNLISVYFAVLFVGLGVDFGIQFSVRYRSERHAIPDLGKALIETGRYVAGPLTLAACATAAGFFSFLPTDYKGVSELGLIAGVGMMIAFVSSVTLLPALLYLFKPPGEPEALGYPALAPVDNFLARHRVAILTTVLLVVFAASPLLYWVRFDFNPLNLRSTKVESVSTYLELKSDPENSANNIDILAPSLADADALAAKLRALPEVKRAVTLSTFVPRQQDEKLRLIQDAAKALDPSLNPTEVMAPPNSDEDIAAINSAAQGLTNAAGSQNGPGAAAARHLASDLIALARADEAVRARASAAFVPTLKTALDQLRALLSAQNVTLDTLPPDLRRQWTAPDGRARITVSPAGDPNNNDVLRKFARAVTAFAPDAVGGPILILDASRTIIFAFAEAGACALISIFILLWVTLRRLGDVLLTLIPLLLAGVVTLEICVLIDLPLNYANIIALPLLLGVGVAFKIYYIMAWRDGQTNLLQSVLTRAVMFSAATTATAFGSLFFSSHPGTSSMGELLAVSLVCTLAAAALFQPILMGKPRKVAQTAGASADRGASGASGNASDFASKPDVVRAAGVD